MSKILLLNFGKILNKIIKDDFVFDLQKIEFENTNIISNFIQVCVRV